ncbi:hypothetical protein CTKZ_08840 [Cellulomonas algicola]|uniref:Uncharacterized protein n=1 Tax=Cellulomonas algicola TaxID=2071633 RepID=A0A401UXF7_9CELL|nr:hypothetical protein CTKZ_08840 [Cellulomonas algicola]
MTARRRHCLSGVRGRRHPLDEASSTGGSPGCEPRRTTDPDGLRAACDALQRTWDATDARTGGPLDDTVDEPVDGEWSFAQTLRPRGFRDRHVQDPRPALRRARTNLM